MVNVGFLQLLLQLGGGDIEFRVLQVLLRRLTEVTLDSLGQTGGVNGLVLRWRRSGGVDLRVGRLGRECGVCQDAATKHQSGGGDSDSTTLRDLTFRIRH